VTELDHLQAEAKKVLADMWRLDLVMNVTFLVRARFYLPVRAKSDRLCSNMILPTDSLGSGATPSPGRFWRLLICLLNSSGTFMRCCRLKNVLSTLPFLTLEHLLKRLQSLDGFMQVSSYFLAEAYDFWKEYKPLLDGSVDIVTAALEELSSPSPSEDIVTPSLSEAIAKRIVEDVVNILT
jgi:hypothetical protein